MITVSLWIYLGIAASVIFINGVISALQKWLVWRRCHITHREFAALTRRLRGAQQAFREQQQKWLDGNRSVRGLEDLRASLDEFCEVINMLIKESESLP